MATYLLRFDDICPTMNHARWKRVESLMRRFSIRPILAIVPDNQDPKLAVAPADPEFWTHMRRLQEEGWTIGLHGLRHDCRVYGKSLLPLHRYTEFAGLTEEEQTQMLREGALILQGHGLNPEVWVAPRHGFDRNTLSALKRVGIKIVSDGYSRFPFVDDGLLWIPQQLWGGRRMQNGVWTICVHANTIAEQSLHDLETFIEHHAAEFVGVKEIDRLWGNRKKHLGDTLHSQLWLCRIRARHLARQSLRRIRGTA